MKTGMRWACLCGTVLIASQLQESEPPEIRVWLIDAEEKPVSLEGFRAILTVTDLKGWKKTYLMPVAPPRDEAAGGATPRGEIRKVPGTPYLAELLFVKPVARTANEPPKSAPQVFDLPHLPRETPADGTRESSEATVPSFRSPLPKEDLPRTGELAVHLSLPDGMKQTVRWTLPLWGQETPNGEGWNRPWTDLAEVDRHLRLPRMDPARDAADRLVRSLQDALKDAELDAKKSEECLGAALEIRRRLEENDADRALESVNDCRVRFREIAPFPDRLEREK